MHAERTGLGKGKLENTAKPHLRFRTHRHTHTHVSGICRMSLRTSSLFYVGDV